MAVDPRVLRLALIPVLLIVCITVALWQLRTEEHQPAVPSPAHTISPS